MSPTASDPVPADPPGPDTTADAPVPPDSPGPPAPSVSPGPPAPSDSPGPPVPPDSPGPPAPSDSPVATTTPVPTSTLGSPVPPDSPVATPEPVPADFSVADADTPLRARLRAESGVLVPLLVLVLCTYAYFIGPPAWNQNSRLALTRALVEQRTTIIDDYHVSTGDKSLRGGHFYSDKAPGASLLAVPGYALYWAVTRATGGELPEVRVVPLYETDQVDDTARKPGDRLAYNQPYRTALYLARLLSTSLLAALGVCALYLLARRQLARQHALLLAAIYGLATPALVYSSALYGHQLCADLLLLGLAIPLLSEGTSRPRAAALATGVCLGLAVVCEYPAAVPVVLLAALALARRGPRFAAWLCLGGLPCALVLAAYHLAAFGHPLKTGYDFVYLAEFAEGMRINYGIHTPDPAVLLELTFGRFRGLFYLAPVLLLAAWGLVAQLVTRPSTLGPTRPSTLGPTRPSTLAPTRPSTLGPPRPPCTWPTRQVALTALLVIAFYLALNSGYYMWDGGAAVGPRHCVPMLPFLALGLVPALRLVPGAVLVLGLVSAAQMLAAAAAAPEAPQFGDPLYAHAWPHLLTTQPGYGGATNLGLLLGLPGLLSVVPLLALWWWTWQHLRSQLRPA